MTKNIPLLHRLFVRYARGRKHRGKLRILGWIGRCFNLKSVVAETSAGLMRLNTVDAVQGHILMYGAYEPKTLQLVKDLLGAGDCFLDIGANVGQYALAAAKCVGEGGRVIAVEPSPEICTDLLYNRRLNGFEKTMEVVAMAANEESRLLHFVIPLPTNRGVSREVNRDCDPSMSSYLVSSVRLCDVLETLSVNHVRVVKIDVEGSELRVLKGLFATDRIPPPDHIVFEFLPEHFSYGGAPTDLLQFLEARGYDLLNIAGTPYKYGDAILEQNLWARRKSG